MLGAKMSQGLSPWASPHCLKSRTLWALLSQVPTHGPITVAGGMGISYWASMVSRSTFIHLCVYWRLVDLLEKAMAAHSSTLAWKIPWTEEPGGLQSRGSRRVRHDWATSLSLFTFMHWRRRWQPTPVFLPGKSQGQGSLVGCCLWGHTESDTTEVT